MKKAIVSKLLSVLLAIPIMVGCTPTSQQSQSSQSNEHNVTKNYSIEGKEYIVSYDNTPKKAVSLSSFTTEMMLALGLEESMIGTAYQDNEVLPQFQDAYERIPSISPNNVSREEMIRLQPDFLTGWTSDFHEKNHNPEFCSENGIKMYIAQSESDTATLDDVYADFRSLGKIFRVEEKAEEIIKDMKNQLAIVQKNIPQNGARKSVFVYDSGLDTPMTVTGGLGDDLITLAGGINVFTGGKTAWAKVSWEDVIVADPEHIILLRYNKNDDVSQQLELLQQDPSLKNITAVKEGNILELTLVDMLPGVRNAKTVDTINQAIWGE